MFLKSFKLSAGVGLALLLLGGAAYSAHEVYQDYKFDRGLTLATLTTACAVYVDDYDKPLSEEETQEIVEEIRAMRAARAAGIEVEPLPQITEEARRTAEAREIMYDACRAANAY